MPKSVLNQIKFLCKEIPRQEWSGVLFYDIEGTIKEPAKMKIILKDILPLDKGSGTYTSYDLDDVLIDFMMDNPSHLNYKIGHIHSHNVMNVFFSGTDMDEICENSENHNFYLSLIVNNYMDFTAKVAFRVKTESEIITRTGEYTALDENGEVYVIAEGKEEVEKEVSEEVCIYDCNILTKSTAISVGENFRKSVKTIIDKANVKPAYQTSPRAWPTKRPNPSGAVKYWDAEAMEMVTEKEWNRRKGIKVKNHDNVAHNPVTPSEEDWGAMYHKFFQEEDDEDIAELNFNYENDELENVIISVIKATNPPKKGETVEYALANASIGDDTITGEELKERFSSYYANLVEKYIPNAIDDIEKFEEVTKDALELLEAYEMTYPELLPQSIMFLKKVMESIKEKN